MPVSEDLKAFERAKERFAPRHATQAITCYQYWGRVVKVVDGDTVDVNLALGFNLDLQVRLRLLGVDTPEIHSVRHDSDEYAAGMEAKRFVEKRLPVDSWAEIAVYGERTEKYGRWLAEVFTGGESLNRELVSRGYGSA